MVEDGELTYGGVLTAILMSSLVLYLLSSLHFLLSPTPELYRVMTETFLGTILPLFIIGTFVYGMLSDTPLGRGERKLPVWGVLTGSLYGLLLVSHIQLVWLYVTPVVVFAVSELVVRHGFRKMEYVE